MTMTRMRWLLVGWWCATVVPGVAVALLFSNDLADGGGGWVVLIWVVGYLVQLFLFMAVSRQIEGVTAMAVVWFVVSLLPWAVDWSLLANWWAGLSFVCFAVVVAGYVELTGTSAALLQRDGLRATAVVMEVKKPLMNVVVNNVYIKRTLRLRIERDDKAPSYLASYTGLFMLGDVPDRGDKLRVVVDPKRPQRVAAAEVTGRQGGPESAERPDGQRPQQARSTWRFTSWHGPGSSQKAPRRARPPASPAASRGSAYTVYEPAAPAAPAAPAGPAGRDLAGSLSELAALHERGQLTDEEFAQAKRELLGSEDSAPPE